MVGHLASFWQAGSGRVCHTVLWVLSHIDRRRFELKFSRHGFILCLCTVLLGLAGGLLAFAMFVLFDRVMVALWMELWYCDSEIKWQAATWGMWLLSCLQISFCCSDLCESPCVWLGGCYRSWPQNVLSCLTLLFEMIAVALAEHFSWYALPGHSF